MGKDAERIGLGQAGRNTGKESAERRERQERHRGEGEKNKWRGRERERRWREGSYRELRRKKTQKNIDTEGHEDGKIEKRKIWESPC